MAPHEEFLELCAVSISGELIGDERKRLEEHLKGCASCREALEQFKKSVQAAIPPAAEQGAEAREVDPSFSVDKAEVAFFSRFDREGGFDGFETKQQTSAEVAHSNGHDPGVQAGAGWGQLWMPFVAILLLSVTLGIASYRIGMKKGVETAATPQQGNTATASLEEQLSNAGHEREHLVAQIAARDQSIAGLFLLRSPPPS